MSTRDKSMSFALQWYLEHHGSFDPWSPVNRSAFRSFLEKDLEKYRSVIEGGSTKLLDDQEPPSDWISEDLPHITPFQPRSPSDGSVSTDKPENLERVKLQNQLHLFVKDAAKPGATRTAALLDSGAESNCVSEEFAKRSGAVVDLGPRLLLSADGRNMETIGEAKLKIAWLKGRDFNHAKISCHVIRNLQHDVILSEQTVCGHNLRDVAASSLDPVPTIITSKSVCPIKLSRRSKQKAEEDQAKLQTIASRNSAREMLEAQDRALQRARMASPASNASSTSVSIGTNSNALSQTNASTGTTASADTTATSISSNPEGNGKP